MSERGRSPAVLPGSGGPITERGRSVAYLPPPWHMRGRTLAMWFRLQDPDEARRHVPSWLEMDEDPVVRARFWDMTYDAVPGPEPPARGTRGFLEAVIAFPVRYGDTAGDYPTYMYADDWVYVVAGREVQGWNVREADVSMDPVPAGGLAAGSVIGAELRQDGSPIMRASLTLSGEREDTDDSSPPVWLTTKIVPDASGPTAQVGQLLATGPRRIDSRIAWSASATLELEPSPASELHHLAPREIVEAQYWSDVDITVGWGRVLAELGDRVWDR